MARWWSAGDADYAPAPYPNVIGWPAHAVDGGLLWVFGGWGPGYAVETAVRTFDPGANAWTTRTAMGANPYFDGPGAAIYNGVAYLQGNTGFFGYTLADGSWAALASPPGGNATQQSPVVVDGLIYSKLYDTTNPCVYDPATDTWDTITPWPARVAAGGFGAGMSVAVGSLIYTYWQGLLASYDPATDTWTDLASHGAARIVDNTTLVHLNGVLHLIGGEGDVSSNEEAFHSTYTIADDTWATETDLPVARYGSAIGVASGRIFVVGGEATSGLLDTHSMWADTAPTPGVEDSLSVTLDVVVEDTAELAVSLSVGWDPQAILPVTFDTVADDAASAVLKVVFNTGVEVESILAVTLGTVAPDGVVQTDVAAEPLPADRVVGPSRPVSSGVSLTAADDATVEEEAALLAAVAEARISAEVSESFGRGRTANLSAEGTVDLTGVSLAELYHRTVAITGVVTEYAAAFEVEPNPNAGAWRRANGVPTSEVTTRDSGWPLDTTYLTEIVPVYEDELDVELYPLDAELGSGLASEDDTLANDTVGGPLPSRLSVARSAAAQAGFSLVLLSSLPSMTEPIDEDYRTEGRTARSVISDLLLECNPRTWIRGRTMWIDARALTGGAPSADVSAFVDDAWVDQNTVAWSDQPAQDPGPEPLLEDYLAECEDEAQESGTFETWTDGSYSWWESGGVGDDFSQTFNAVTKVDSRLTSESTIEYGYRRHSVLNTKSYGELTRTDVRHRYHELCPEALVGTTETIVQRKTVEDLAHFNAHLDDVTEEDTGNTPPGGYGPYDEQAPTKTSEEALWDALPLWYTQKEARVYQRWHAEGWLRSRRETIRELDGMLAIPQESVGPDPSYEIHLLYKETTRSDVYLPAGGGLWFIKRQVHTTQQQPVYEPVNPDAVEGDEGFGEMEVVDSRAMRVSHSYTEVTDQAPPTVSCDDDCVEDATARWTHDHAVWLARQQLGRAKRVWSFTTARMMADFSVGQLIGDAIVSAATHAVGGGVGMSEIEIWEFLE